MIVQDGPGQLNNLKNALDNLIADKRLPRIIGIFVNHGGGDGKGSERGLEYDTMSDRYTPINEWPPTSRQRTTTIAFVYSKGAIHCDAAVAGETIPTTLQWMWRGYPIP
jgi:hypothetical protein